MIDEMINRIILGDCMDIMPLMPELGWDVLAIVDPEFGINIGESARLVTDKGLKAKKWDSSPPDKKYFNQLFEVSKDQIIWGGNYFDLPPNKHCLIWDKKQPEKLSFGMFDYAWTSFDGSNKIFRRSVQDEKNKIHPTQKPIALYRWLLQNYAKPGQLILDTHSGSGSLACACHLEKYDFIAIEKDPDYHRDSVKRLDELRDQGRLF